VKDLLFEVDNNIATIILNRPKSLNAFSEEMIDLWISSLEEIRDNDNIYVGILTGNGKGFCAGGDIKAMMSGEGFMAKTRGEDSDFISLPLFVKDGLWNKIQRIPLLMEEIDKPMIAAINGAAIGAGLDMALMCDIRFCSENAKLGQGYINAGIVPGDGGGYYLPRIIGIDKALELFWTGKNISGQKAKEIGLITHLVSEESLMDEALKFAKQITDGPQEVIKMMKRIVYESSTMTLKQSLDLVSSFMAIAVHHPDHKEAIRAMKAKQRPVYKEGSS